MAESVADLIALGYDDFPEVVPVPSHDVERARILTELARRDPRLSNLSPSDPGYAMAEEAARVIIHERTRMNDQIKQCLLVSAKGQAIDAIGAARRVTREPDESDEAYKSRVYLDILADSAGTLERYTKVALDADPRIARVAVHSPSPSVVYVGWVPADSGDAGDAGIDAAVRAAVTDPDNRMLADRVHVFAGSPRDYTMRIVLQTKPGVNRGALEASARSRVTSWATEWSVPGRSVIEDYVRVVAGDEAAQSVGAVVELYEGGVLQALPVLPWPAPPVDATVVSVDYWNFDGLELSSQVAAELQR